MAAQLGYCGLDRQRKPLRGDEIRACWESLDAPGAPVIPTRPTLGPAAGWALEPGEDRTPVRLRDFIEVAETGWSTSDGPESEIDLEPAALTTSGELRWSLWGDAEG